MKCHLLTKRLLLFLFIIIFNVVAGGAERKQSPPISGWLPNEINLDRTEIPKNIMVGVTDGGKLGKLGAFDREI